MIATFGYILVRNNFFTNRDIYWRFYYWRIYINIFNIIARLQAHCNISSVKELWNMKFNYF